MQKCRRSDTWDRPSSPLLDQPRTARPGESRPRTVTSHETNRSLTDPPLLNHDAVWQIGSGSAGDYVAGKKSIVSGRQTWCLRNPGQSSYLSTSGLCVCEATGTYKPIGNVHSFHSGPSMVLVFS